MALSRGKLVASLVIAGAVFLSLKGTSCQKAPYFIQEPTDIVAKKNRHAVLNCTAGGHPTPRISWNHNGLPLNLGNDNRRKILPDGSLYFKTIEHSKSNKPDEGQYQCVAMSHINNLDYVVVSRTAQLRVSGLSSKIVIEPGRSQVPVIYGDVARLHCKVRHAIPTAIIQWKFKQKKQAAVTLTASNKITLLPGGILQIRNTQFSDEGDYMCTARNPASGRQHSSAFVPLKVKTDFGYQRGPDFVAQASSTNATKGSRVVLECAVKGKPKPIVRWYKNKQQLTLDANIRIIGESNLEISRISSADAGSYTCEASANHRNVSHTIQLEVHYLPVLTRKPRNRHAAISSDATFYCTADASPEPLIHWTKNGVLIEDSDYTIVGNGFMRVEDLLNSDMGIYQCFASNFLGNVQGSAELSIYKGVTRSPTHTSTPTTPTTTPPTTKITTGPTLPYKPQNVQAVTLSVSEIEVSWSPPKKTFGKILSYNILYTVDTVGGGKVHMINTSGSNLRVKISNLLPNTEYTFHVYANNKYGTGRISREAVARTATTSTPTTPTTAPPTTKVTTGPTLPGKPQNVRAVTLSVSEIEVSWSPPKKTFGNILSYNIFYTVDTVGGGKVHMISTSGSNLRVKISNLLPNTEYTFRVYAENKYGTGTISREAVARTATLAKVPTAPQALVAIGISSDQIRVHWGAPASGTVKQYVLEYQETSGKSPKATAITQRQQRTLSHLKTYTEYRLQVYAISNDGLRGNVATTTAWTQGGIPKGKPQDLSLMADSSGKGLIITWKPPQHSLVNGKINKYALEYRRVGRRKSKALELLGVQLSLHLRKLNANTVYEARVAAGTRSGFGDFTQWVRASTNVTKCSDSQIPGTPTELLLTIPFKGQQMIMVEWQAPVDVSQICVTGYILDYGQGTPFHKNVKVNASTTSHLIKNLSAGKKYVVKVMAINSKDNNGGNIQEEIFIPSVGARIKPVREVQAVPLSPTAVHISWVEFQDRKSQLYHVYHALRKTVMYCGNTTMKVFNCTGLKPYTYYTFLVRRNGEKINGTATNQTLEGKPSPPMDLTGSPAEDNTTGLYLFWQIPERVNGKILRYKIYYSTNPNAAVELWGKKVCNGTTMQALLKGLTPATKYYFKMRVENGAGWSKMSKMKMIVTTGDPTTGNGPTELTPSVAARVEGGAGMEDKTLWIIIAAVAGITLIAIIIISVVLCKKRSGDDIQSPRKPPTIYKSAVIANGSAKKKNKNKNKEEKRPDLWINHTDNMEMKPVLTHNPTPVNSISRSMVEMKPIESDPLIERKFEPERSSFRKGSDSEIEPDALPPPPPHMLDNDDDTPADYSGVEDAFPSPISTPTRAPNHPVVTYPISGTPDSGRPYPAYPLTSTPHHDSNIPRSGSFENSPEPLNSTPPQRSKSYDFDYSNPKQHSKTMVPVFPMPNYSDGPHYKVPAPVKSKPTVAPMDDIQLPPVGYNRGPGIPRGNKMPNGIRSPPPTYEDLYQPHQPRDTTDVEADLDKEIAGLEGLMKDLNDITCTDYIV